MNSPSLGFLETVGLLAIVFIVGWLLDRIFPNTTRRVERRAIGCIGLILASIIILVGEDLFTSITSNPPTFIPAETQIADSATRYPLLQPTALPTSTTKSCVNAFFVTAADAGKTLCVYGRIYDIQFLTYNNTSRIVFSDQKGFFFVCVECYFPDTKKGDCVQGQGIVELSYDKLPFINLKRKLYSSSYCK